MKMLDNRLSGPFTDTQTAQPIRRGPVDSWLLGAVLLLILSGELFVLNTTYFYAFDRFDDPYLFVRKHNLALVIGCLGCLVALALPSTVFRTLTYPALIGAFISLCLVLLPGFSHGNVQRWLSFGGLNFQPSEFAKGAVVLYLAYALAKKADRLHSFVYGLLPLLLVVGCVVVLIALEPDLGGAVFISLLLAAVLFVAGARGRHLAVLVGVGLLCLSYGVLSAEYRTDRFLTFLDQSADLQGEGYQLNQSRLAFGAGGVSGVGLGESRQKMFYLPEAHTDFIFAVIGEEIGLWGTTGIVLLFGLFGARGLRVASYHPTQFGRLLAFGCTFSIVCQAGINMAVVVGLLPITGLPLPFVSYGGSALVISLFCTGMLLRLSREVQPREGAHA
ncbi:MAG: putative lipid II flippase FtsW [Desulfurellaceae bacterium]|nr:putative lipid II flippase FtsW [Desulfurellaceae bacterium]